MKKVYCGFQIEEARTLLLLASLQPYVQHPEAISDFVFLSAAR